MTTDFSKDSVRLFRDDAELTSKIKTSALPVDKQEEYRQENSYYCAMCKNHITEAKEIISINGMHEHYFNNPNGVGFLIGCFRDAYGCGALGSPTAEHTWFKGYTWDIVVCAKCLIHLGWLYESDSDSFYGFILNRLINA
ncbi:Yippee-like protein [Candidatus Magnetoovum chiemensis]|nr:Yippee-like protein [Candidatus Magnetoovum chiemensis]